MDNKFPRRPGEGGSQAELTKLDIKLNELSKVLFGDKTNLNFLKEVLINNKSYICEGDHVNGIDYILKIAKLWHLSSGSKLRNFKVKAKSLLLKNIYKGYQKNPSEEIDIAIDIVSKNNQLERNKFPPITGENILNDYVHNYLGNIADGKSNYINKEELINYLKELTNSNNETLKKLGNSLIKEILICYEKTILGKLKIIDDDIVIITDIEGKRKEMPGKDLYQIVKIYKEYFTDKKIKKINSIGMDIIFDDDGNAINYAYQTSEEDIPKKDQETTPPSKS